MQHARVLLAALLPLVLAGCAGDDVSRNFGLTRDAPDEFQVTTRAPLSMPPDYTLRPPRPGASRPQEMSQRQAAEATLAPQAALGNPAQDATSSAGQQAFLAASGPAAPADIRRRVDADASREQTDRSLTDELMFWRTPRDKSVTVDPTREAQRLQENAAMGESPVVGDTPIIQRKSESLWDKLF
jgi:hypothetical protein